MDMHNDPIDYAVAVADDRPSGWLLRIVVAEPLIVGVAGFLLGCLVSQGG